MSLRSPKEDEKPTFVMPAWIAGIQVRKDASGDIRVDLDSSLPCWKDRIEDRCFELSETPLATFSKKDAKSTKENRFCLKTEKKKRFLRDLRALRGKYFFYASSVPRVRTRPVQVSINVEQ